MALDIYDKHENFVCRIIQGTKMELHYHQKNLEVEMPLNYLQNHPLPEAELNYHQKDFVTMMDLDYLQKYLGD